MAVYLLWTLHGFLQETSPYLLRTLPPQLLPKPQFLLQSSFDHDCSRQLAQGPKGHRFGGCKPLTALDDLTHFEAVLKQERKPSQ